MKMWKERVAQAVGAVAFIAALVVAAAGWLWMQQELSRLADGVALVTELSAKGR